MLKKKRRLTDTAVSARIFQDNFQYLDTLRKATGENISDLPRDVLDEGIKARKVRENRWDETAEYFKNYMTIALNNTLRPWRKQMDDIGNAIERLNDTQSEKFDDLIERSNKLTERAVATSNRLERLSDKVSELPAALSASTPALSIESLDTEQILDELKTLRQMTEVALGNLVGLRTVMWLYLYDIMLPMAGTYDTFDERKLGQVIKDQIHKLFNEDVLKEIAFMKAGQLEDFIQFRVLDYYAALRDEGINFTKRA